MREQDDVLRHRQFPAMFWVLLAVCGLSLHTLLPGMLFHAQSGPAPAFLIPFHACCALLVWACAAQVSAPLARCFPAALAPRMLAGLALVAAGVAAIGALVYHILFPAWTGLAAGAADHAAAWRACLAAMCVYGWLLMRDHANAEAARALTLRTETDALKTALDHSGLAMLEAQIEPHFLFNTLAHIKRLYRVDDAAAAHVLGDLIDWLERSLPALARADWSVGDEVDLVTLYLNLIEQRFCDRLRFSITVTGAARALPLPALTLATLVENAVRHGLGPKAGAGRIAIGIALDKQALTIDVLDDGVGLRQSSGNGLGLATVRARLRGSFGDAASLLVAPGDAGGVRSSIRVAARAYA